MNLFFLHPTNHDLKEPSDTHTLIHHEHPLYMDEGSEFLDDALRMEDLPFSSADENVSPESGQNNS